MTFYENSITLRFMVYVVVICNHLIVKILGGDGYILYCPCMGRFGNQADHFLGSLGFAKGLNRTLVLPPWIEYRYGEPKSMQIPFDNYFKIEPLKEFHHVVPMEDFMKNTAPQVWPLDKRKESTSVVSKVFYRLPVLFISFILFLTFTIAFCYMARGTNDSCNPKEGNPFGPFWNHFNVDFVGSELYSPLHYDVYNHNMASQWNEKYPLEQWPVLAFTGAPASFPVQKENKDLHKYLQWNSIILSKATKYIKEFFPRGGFIGIHLRNGPDWIRACEHVNSSPMLFSSPQCFGYRGEYGHTTFESCLPPKDLIVKQLKRIVRSLKDVASIFVASDNNHMISDLQDAFKRTDIKIVRHPENNPHIDLAILGLANHFIGNCVSSYSAFAKRERDAKGLPSTFWGFPPSRIAEKHDEL